MNQLLQTRKWAWHVLEQKFADVLYTGGNTVGKITVVTEDMLVSITDKEENDEFS